MRLRSFALAAMFFLCVLAPAAALAIEPEVGAGTAVDWERNGPEVDRPTPFQTDFLRRLEAFDRAYADWQLRRLPDGPRWERLAEQEFGQYQLNQAAGENGAFVLRGVLLRAECQLFASIDYLQSGRRDRALMLYKEGIWTLHELLLDAEANPSLDSLPEYGRQTVAMVGEGRTIHPWAGYETVGTGIVSSDDQLVPGPRYLLHEVTGIASGEAYGDLLTLKEVKLERWFWCRDGVLAEQQRHGVSLSPDEISRRAAEPYGRQPGKQKSSSQTARLLLGQFCPWGARVYFMMEKMGIPIDELDYRILRPFAPEYDVVVEAGGAIADFFSLAGTLVTSATVDWDVWNRLAGPGASEWPVLSELNLPNDHVPPLIRKEVEAIVGQGGFGHLDPAGRSTVKWHWVGEPSYSVWYASPRVFDPSASEYLKYAFTVVKLIFSGVKDVVVDQIISGLVEFIGSQQGVSTQYYWTCKLLAEANDKGVFTTSMTTKGEWLSGPAVARKLAGHGFAMVDEFERQANFEGIDPRVLSLGTSYDGSVIPPVIIRADVVGFVNPEDDYPYWVHNQRYFLLRPEGFAYRNPELLRNLPAHAIYTRAFEDFFTVRPSLTGPGFDLATHGEYGLAHEAEYLTGNERIHGHSWQRLPGHLGARALVFEPDPFKQVITLPLTEGARQVVAENHGLRVQLLPAQGSSAELHVDMPLQRPEMTNQAQNYGTPQSDAPVQDPVMFLYLSGSDDARSAKIADNPELLRASAAPRIYNVQDAENYSARMREQLANSPEQWIADVKAVYTLRVTNGNGVLEERRIVLDPGVKQARTVTGTVVSPQPGVVEIKLEPPFDLLRLETALAEITPAGEAPPVSTAE